MVYAAYADDRDRLDHVVDNVTEDAGGDMRAAILELVRRQHRSDDAGAVPAVASAKRRRA